MNKKPEFKPKVTPEQVNKALKKKNNPGKNKVPEQAKEKKPKAKRKRKAVKFPLKAKINDYGFLHFEVGLLSALGWHKGMPLTIEKNEDASVTPRKA